MTLIEQNKSNFTILLCYALCTEVKDPNSNTGLIACLCANVRSKTKPQSVCMRRYRGNEQQTNQ